MMLLMDFVYYFIKFRYRIFNLYYCNVRILFYSKYLIWRARFYARKTSWRNICPRSLYSGTPITSASPVTLENDRGSYCNVYNKSTTPLALTCKKITSVITGVIFFQGASPTILWEQHNIVSF
jgi:hypothetical protein